VDFECTSTCGSSRSRSAGLLLASLAALAVACATATRAPETAEVPGQAPAEAMAEYREAVRLDPISAVAHANLGSALVEQGELEQALAEFLEATRLEPTNADWWMRLGQLYDQMGRGEEALHSLETGLEADPGNAGILNHMGWFYATAEPSNLRDPAKALAYAQRAVEASSGRDANILDTLAEAYYANQDFDEAIETEERALEIAPELEALQNQLEKFREAKATESGR
jgi:tetratricopeptide (TPR) repeat protein